MKYTKEIKDKIYKLKASGDFNDKEIQEAVGISTSQWHEWKNTKSEFAELLKKADSEFIENKIKKSARKGLRTLLEGKEWEETTVEYKLVKDKNGNEVAKKVGEKRIKKFIMPNPISVIFALKNSDPDNFKDKQEIDHTTKGEKISPNIIVQDQKTSDEINRLINK